MLDSEQATYQARYSCSGRSEFPRLPDFDQSLDEFVIPCTRCPIAGPGDGLGNIPASVLSRQGRMQGTLVPAQCPALFMSLRGIAICCSFARPTTEKSFAESVISFTRSPAAV